MRCWKIHPTIRPSKLPRLHRRLFDQRLFVLQPMPSWTFSEPHHNTAVVFQVPSRIVRCSRFRKLSILPARQVQRPRPYRMQIMPPRNIQQQNQSHLKPNLPPLSPRYLFRLPRQQQRKNVQRLPYGPPQHPDWLGLCRQLRRVPSG